MKLLLELDLQFFAEVPNPELDDAEKKQEGEKGESEKKFTQEDLNRINIKGKEDGKKAIYKQLGISTDDEFKNLLNLQKENSEKVTKLAEIEKEVNELRAEKLKNTYLLEIRRSNVADEYIDVVYSAVIPQDKETPEAYNVRVNDYLKTRPALLRSPSGIQYFNTNSGYNGKPAVDNNPVSLGSALSEKYKK